MRRLCAFFLALLTLLSLVPVNAQAEGSAAPQQSITVAPNVTLPDNDTLFRNYAASQLYSSNSAPIGISAGELLTGDVKILYDAAVPIIRQIAEGKRSSTIITVGKTFSDGYTLHEPDVQAVFAGSTLTSGDLTKLVGALLSDLPCEMYWYDKTVGCRASMWNDGTLLFVSLKFTVARNYRTDTYATDTRKAASLFTAISNAQHIVNAYTSASDYNKLMGYSHVICDLTAYDHQAASTGVFSENNDPWQLIHVFDGDPATKVVCEGYAKAYQYLCDLSSFSGDVDCYSVTGTMDGALHMWNIVALEGRNYLLDATNTDDTNRGRALLLAGCRGSAAGGYTVSRLTYRYDTTTKNLWGTERDSILNLSASAYTSRSQDHDHSYGSWTQAVSATGSSIGIQSRTCKKCGYVDTSCTGVLQLKAPSVSISGSSTTGQPKLSWRAVTGADRYDIYRSTQKNGTYTCIDSVSGASFADTTAEPGIVYYYKVCALESGSGVVSPASAIVSRMCDLAKPAVTVSPNPETGKPVLQWEAIEGAAKYYVYRASSKSGTYKRVKTCDASTVYEDTSAKIGTTYYYKVKAIHGNEDANSAYSSIVSQICCLKQPAVSVSLTVSGQPTVKWETVSGAAKYYIYRAESEDGEFKYVKSTTSAKSYTDTATKAGSAYYYQVKAVHKKTSANSAYSDTVSICSEYIVLEKPNVSTTAKASSGKPLLQWDAVEGAAKYTVYRASSKSGSYTKVGTCDSSTVYEDTCTKVGATYYYKVKAIHENGENSSPYSSIVSQACVLKAPEVSIACNDAGQPTVSWKTVTGAEKYYIYRATGEDGEFERVKSAASARSYTDTTAEPGITYYYRIKAIHKKTEANSAYSDIVSICCQLVQPDVEETEKPETSEVSVSISLSKKKPKISWETVEGAEKYYVYRSTKATSGFKSIKTAVSARSCTDTSAKSGKTYYYKVKAVIGDTAVYSEVVSIKVK